MLEMKVDEIAKGSLIDSLMVRQQVANVGSISFRTDLPTPPESRIHFIHSQMGHPSLDAMEMMEALSAGSGGNVAINDQQQQQMNTLNTHNPFAAVNPNSGNHPHTGGSHPAHVGLHGMYTHAAMGHNMMVTLIPFHPIQSVRKALSITDKEPG